MPSGDSAWTTTLVDALKLVGVEESAARQALARASKQGLLSAERVGRRTRWSLTARAVEILESGAERIYSFGREPKSWDGQWLLVLTTVPEHNRHLRVRLRTRMAWQGLGVLSPGTWISPWAEKEEAVQAVLEELALTATSASWIGRPGGLGSVAERVDRIWDLVDVAADYGSFLSWAHGEGVSTDAEAFAAVVRLVHRWRQFPASDPVLPAELLPSGWPADEAAETFHRRRDAWRTAAWRWWDTHCGG